MNKVIMLLNTNKDILLEVMPKLKFNNYTEERCLVVVTEFQFTNLYSTLTAKGYNPYMLMSWTSTEQQTAE